MKKCDQCQRTKNCKHYEWHFQEDSGITVLCKECKKELESNGYRMVAEWIKKT